MSKPYDALTRNLLEKHPADWLALLGLDGGGPVRLLNSDLSTVTTEADKVLLIEAPQPWLAHVEIQASYDSSLPRRLLRYYGLLDVRYNLPVHVAAVLLWRDADGPALTGTLRQQSPDGRCGVEFRYQVIRLWEYTIDDLAAGLGTIPLTAVAVQSEEELTGVVDRMKTVFNQTPVPDEGELWASLYILIGRRFNREIADRLLQGVRGMTESATYQAILKEGFDTGLKQGREEGRIDGARRLLIRLATRRFGAPSAAIAAELEGISSLMRLDDLADRVPTASGWDELLKNLA